MEGRWGFYGMGMGMDMGFGERVLGWVHLTSASPLFYEVEALGAAMRKLRSR